GFAGVLISPYLHNYRLEYSAHAKFFDLCAKRGVPVWINTSLGDDRFRDARLITRTVLPEDILEFTENAPRNRYVFQGVLPTPELSKQLPEYCKLECSKLSDHEYAPEEFFSRGAVEHLCFGSEYPFRDFGSVSNVLEGKL
ncbi:MAG: amidohydrolase family protein, partial [Lentisphaeria bacterium]|nr:amidohydrolase family protein [Lentisphaeria bacterium]